MKTLFFIACLFGCVLLFENFSMAEFSSHESGQSASVSNWEQEDHEDFLPGTTVIVVIVCYCLYVQKNVSDLSAGIAMSVWRPPHV
ncbi:MAG: hypothetical protein LWX56_11805 [Ignavibacteria bacterium]|nr:hypothetical protein [Ignavibacteria bacterium]